MADTLLTHFRPQSFNYTPYSSLDRSMYEDYVRTCQQKQSISKGLNTSRPVQFETQHGKSRTLHSQYWQVHIGNVLHNLFSNAGYPRESHSRYLHFFATLVTPSLGCAPIDNRCPRWTRWPSFMTDDGTPIELSWDWGDGTVNPTIRFSMEPVGLQAGTKTDLYNKIESQIFIPNLLQATCKHKLLPGMSDRLDLEWFDHFDRYFRVPFLGASNDLLGQSTSSGGSHIFLAFDLLPQLSKSTCKAYFFPELRAALDGISNVEAISNAIEAAPQCFDEISGLQSFRAFASEMTSPLEVDMLAIDLVRASKSRIKVYFRCRETNFQTIKSTMTLGGRILTPGVDRGLHTLRQLWHAVLDAPDNDAAQLCHKHHRTAGVLFNLEFNIRGDPPVVKIYIPVRHYGRNDDAILQGLCTFLDSRSKGWTAAYARVIKQIL